MEIEKLFSDLDSNQSQECEEAKKQLVDLFNQTKDVWLVNGMMEYFLKTGSLQILEVLVKAQSPHYKQIFDKLSDWIKSGQKQQALTLFGFIVRKHPTWLCKIEKHKIIKDILKLLQNEKEIVSLMSALFCIVTLLPIIPMMVSPFLNELFEVFGHLATWNCQNAHELSEYKLAHLKHGLYLLFNRLYGMYPSNFLTYLSELTKREKGGMFQHTIEPLLSSVRVHPMLVTGTPETEVSKARWKYREPHDVVVECAKLSVVEQEPLTEYVHPHETPLSLPNQSLFYDHPTYSGIASPFQSLTDRDHISEYKKGDTIWSPYNEIMSKASTMPHTPTPSYGMPMSSSSSIGPMGAIMDSSGSSPPEAAVEATPETTPMKELTMKPSNNPHAVCAIFTSSQPASPMRREPGSQFTFSESPGPSSSQHGEVLIFNKMPTKLYDQKMQHILNERRQVRLNANVNANANASNAHPTLSPLTLDSDTCSVGVSNNGTPTFDSQAISQEDEEVRDLTSTVALRIDHAKKDPIAKRCINRSDGTDSITMSIDKTRVARHLYKDTIWNRAKASDEMNGFVEEQMKISRARSCPTINSSCSDLMSSPAAVKNKGKFDKSQFLSSKFAMHSIHREGVLRKQSCTTTSRITQTINPWPECYENLMFDLITETSKLRSECNVPQPQEILNQYIEQAVKLKELGSPLDQELYALLQLQLRYEQYRREIHAERNRRLMGRSRDICSLEREQDRLKEKLKNYQERKRQLQYQIDNNKLVASENERKLKDELNSWKSKYQDELEHKKLLQANNENLQCRLDEEIQRRTELASEVDSLRGQMFDIRNELQHAQLQAEQGQQCKQELVRLESEFLVMGEVQIKLRDRLAEVDNLRARDEEINHMKDSYNIEIKELRRALEEKSSQFESAKHRLGELQAQVLNSEKVVADQKRLLKTVQDEYEDKFKALDKKYKVQKDIIVEMEKTILNLYTNQTPVSLAACSPDTDRTDIASSVDRNSSLSTSLASNDSLPASLRSVSEIRNLQAFAEPSNTATAAIGSSATTSISSSDHPHLYHPSTFVEVNAAIGAETSSSSSSQATAIATSSATHTLDIPVSVASKSHYHPQPKQKSIPQNTRSKRSFVD